MDDVKEARDMFDREIRVGDLCVYPVRQGSSMWMNRLTVQKITYNLKGEAKLSGNKQDGYPVHVSSLDRVAIIGRGNIIPFVE